MRRNSLAALLAAVALVAGCSEGPGSGERLMGTITTALPVLFGAGSDDVGAGRGAPAGFTADAIAANPENYVLLSIAALGVTEPARLIASNGRDQTFVSQSGFTVAFRDGVLVATRGLLSDLHSADGGNLRAVLRAGGGTLSRESEALDSFDRTILSTYDCVVTRAAVEEINLGVRTMSAQRFDERCQGSGVIFENIYWLDNGGEIVASRQYVSPTVAYLRSNRL
jgi:hypothetical protein